MSRYSLVAAVAVLTALAAGCTAPPEIDPSLQRDAGYYRVLGRKIEAWKRLQAQDDADVVSWSQTVRGPSPEDRQVIEERARRLQAEEEKKTKEPKPEKKP